MIGNGAYGSEGKLTNPPNDATDVYQALSGLGFEVMLLRDANKRQIEEAIEQLNLQLRQGGVGVFYYAGHGVQVDGENYLIPIGANINYEDDVKYEAVPLGRILGAMKDARNPANLVLLDACRNNPYYKRTRSGLRGLAYVQAVQGTFISFATAPGATTADGGGRNSPYTASLLKYIQEPNLLVPLLFQRVRELVIDQTGGQQTPWDSSSLTGNFAFKLAEPGSSPPLPRPSRPSPSPVSPRSPAVSSPPPYPRQTTPPPTAVFKYM